VITFPKANVMAVPSSNTRMWSLASIRRAKGISLQEIAGRTKLRVAIVQAIEEGNFHELPGGIYNISYLRQYAREIGADENLLVRWYEHGGHEHGYATPADGGVENDSLVEVPRTAPTHEEIRERAYFLWLERGCPDGNAEEDWLEAEQRLVSPVT
jgi:transcriptional regulator with XRE-family HTH domain